MTGAPALTGGRGSGMEYRKEIVDQLIATIQGTSHQEVYLPDVPNTPIVIIRKDRFKKMREIATLLFEDKHRR